MCLSSPWGKLLVGCLSKTFMMCNVNVYFGAYFPVWASTVKGWFSHLIGRRPRLYWPLIGPRPDCSVMFSLGPVSNQCLDALKYFQMNLIFIKYS